MLTLKKDLVEDNNEKLIDDFNKSVDLSKLDSYKKLTSLANKMNKFQKKHPQIRYVYWGSSDETEIYSSVCRYFLYDMRYTHKDNFAKIFDECCILYKKNLIKIPDEEKNKNELYFQFVRGFTKSIFKYNIPINDDSLLFLLEYKKAIIACSDIGSFANRLSKLISDRDIIKAITNNDSDFIEIIHKIDYKRFNDVLHKIEIYDKNNNTIIPFKYIPFDLLKEEHMLEELKGLKGRIMKPWIYHDHIWGGCCLKNIYIFKYFIWLEKTHNKYTGLEQCIDLMMENIDIDSRYKSDVLQVIDNIKNPTFKKKIMNKYSIIEK